MLFRSRAGGQPQAPVGPIRRPLSSLLLVDLSPPPTTVEGWSGLGGLPFGPAAVSGSLAGGGCHFLDVGSQDRPARQEEGGTWRRREILLLAPQVSVLLEAGFQKEVEVKGQQGEGLHQEEKFLEKGLAAPLGHG